MFEIDFNKYRLIDLSYQVIPPGNEDRPFEIKRGFLADGAYKHDIRTHSHVGTHVEAPAHFFEKGKDTASLPLTSYLGRGILLEVEDARENQAITPDYLEKSLGDLIKEGDIVICRNNDEENKRKGRDFPYLTPEAAEWLKDHHIKMLGIDNFFRLGKDTQSVRKLHHILMSQEITLIEWLDNLKELKKKEFYFIALPYKAKLMDSSWTRAMAIEEKSK